MKKHYLAWLTSLLIILASLTVFTVHASAPVLGTLPLRNAEGTGVCLPGGTGDGEWHISFRVPANRDYALDSFQFVWRILSGNPATRIGAEIHIESLDGASTEYVTSFSDVVVSSISPRIYNLYPNDAVTLLAGRIYVFEFWSDRVGGGCTLVMQSSDFAPTGIFSYVDQNMPGVYIGFQINASPLGEFSISKPPDDRINWQYGDSHIAIIYPTEAGIGVYDYASNSYVDLFFAEDIEQYLENPPAEAVLIAEYESVRAYMLPTGEIQFNIGPDAEGKEYVYIIPSLDNPEDGYGYSIDPNE